MTKPIVVGFVASIALLCMSSLAHAQLDAPAYLAEWGGSGAGNGEFLDPGGVAVDSFGNVYVADSFNRVQKFDGAGNFLTTWGSFGSGDGEFHMGPNAGAFLAVDAADNVYVADTRNHRIQKFDSNGHFLTKWGTLGTADGEFDRPYGIALDAANDVYVVDSNNRRIQKFDSDGLFITKWGGFGSADGEFDLPIGIGVDGVGHVYVTDAINHRIQKFDSGGTFLTKWGSLCFVSGEGVDGCDGQFLEPIGVVADTSGDIYVADRGNSRVQKFDSAGSFLTKWGTFGVDIGQFYTTWGVATDAAGNIYVTGPSGGNRVQKFAPSLGGLITDLLQKVIDFNLHQGISNSLDAKVDSAVAALIDVQENNDIAAINSLDAFINAVEAQRDKKITSAQADILVTCAQVIITALGG